MATDLSRRGFLRGTIGAGAAVAFVRDRALAADSAASAGDSAPSAADRAPAARLPAPSAADAPVAGADTLRVVTTVNGTAHTLDVHPDDTAIAIVRERLGLTGAKESCGHGACGACAIHLDGTPIAACLLPATALEGHAVTTIEGLGPALHPVQRAFLAEDALQCGFCTPGFVMEAITFHDNWRRTHTGEPTQAEVAGALAGHLCRCGAYPSIYAAVIGACAGRWDGEDPEPARIDGREKVTGKAVYTVDVRLAGQLEGRILRSPHANAIVKGIDLSALATMPGVCVSTTLVAPGARVRFAGQEIAAVAAADRRTADAALAAIRVDYEVGVPVIGIAAALAPDAALVYDPPTQDLPLHFEGLSLPLRWDRNRRGPFDMSAFANPGHAHAAVEDTRNTVARARYVTQAQVHTALEPHACVAAWDGAKLVVHLSTQGCSEMADDIAEHAGIAREDVSVACAYVGGAFGAKLSFGMEMRAAIDLARQAGAPVRVANDRAEEMIVGGYRPGMDLDLAVAAAPDGSPAGMVLTALGDGGVSAGATNGLLMRLIYPDAPKSFSDYDVMSHGPPGKPFRGPGGPQALFALEQAVDEVARVRGEDPIVLRRRWDPNPIRQMLYQTAAAHPLWRERTAPDTGRFRRGVGVAAGVWYYLFSPTTQVRLDLAGGKLLASCAGQDMGNGARTVIATAVAKTLGIARSRVDVRVGNSSDVHAVGSAGSRSTASVGPAAADAARQLREELVAWAARGLRLVRPVATVAGIAHATGTLAWDDALAGAPSMSFIGRRRPDAESLPLPASGDVGLGKRLPGAVQITEVEVDTRLGKVRVARVWLGLGVGRIWVPEGARSQAEGGVIQGVGYALYEERRLDPHTGRTLTRGLEDYRIPGLGDVPAIEVHFEERGYEHVNGGGVGLAELSTLCTAASVANAVRHATGWRPCELPVRPDRVLAGVQA
jgi:xanthine dehydrogenase YagR molybdenum-binding subunit